MPAGFVEQLLSNHSDGKRGNEVAINRVPQQPEQQVFRFDRDRAKLGRFVAGKEKCLRGELWLTTTVACISPHLSATMGA